MDGWMDGWMGSSDYLIEAGAGYHLQRTGSKDKSYNGALL